MGVCHPIQTVLYIFVQFLGAMVGAALVTFQAPGLKEYGTNKRARFGKFLNSTHYKECSGSLCDGNSITCLTDAVDKPRKLNKHYLPLINERDAQTQPHLHLHQT